MKKKLTKEQWHGFADDLRVARRSIINLQKKALDLPDTDMEDWTHRFEKISVRIKELADAFDELGDDAPEKRY